jgi:DNA-binding MarR family transcriptional regulator
MSILKNNKYPKYFVCIYNYVLLCLSLKNKNSKYCGCLFFSANALARNLTRIAEQEYKVTGLSPSHALLLLTINEKQGIQPKELAMEMQLTPSTVTRLLDKLESRKYILREEQGKIVKVFSTTRGKALNLKIKNAWLRLYDRYIEVTGIEDGKRMTQWIYETAQKLD